MTKGIRHRQRIRNIFFGGDATSLFSNLLMMLFSGVMVLVVPTGLLFIVIPLSLGLAMRVMITSNKLFF